MSERKIRPGDRVENDQGVVAFVVDVHQDGRHLSVRRKGADCLERWELDTVTAAGR